MHIYSNFYTLITPSHSHMYSIAETLNKPPTLMSSIFFDSLRLITVCRSMRRGYCVKLPSKYLHSHP